MNKHLTVKEIAKALHRWMERGELSQALIAEKLNIHQSQVSRILRGNFKRFSSNVRKFCDEARIDVQAVAPERVRPRKSRRLQKALEEVWDGTERHERALIRVIRSLQQLK